MRCRVSIRLSPAFSAEHDTTADVSTSLPLEVELPTTRTILPLSFTTLFSPTRTSNMSAA